MAKETGEERFQRVYRALRKKTKQQLIESELERQGFSMEIHTCVTCEYFKIWGHDYAQYFDCARDKSNYWSPGPEYIAQNRCLHYQKMEACACPFCSAAGIEKCLTIVDVPPFNGFRPETGYWCGACKTRFRYDNGNPVVAARGKDGAKVIA